MADLENVINEDLTDEERLNILLHLAYLEPNWVELVLEDWFQLRNEMDDAETAAWVRRI
jgi:hypothetical protein